MAQDKFGSKLDTALGRSGNVLDTVNKLLCTINPKRPGCVPVTETTIIQEQRRNTWLLLVMLAIIIVLIVVILRRKK